MDRRSVERHDGSIGGNEQRARASSTRPTEALRRNIPMKTSTHSGEINISKPRRPLGLWSRMAIGVAAAAAVVSAASLSLAAELSPQEAKKIAVDAYHHGYALKKGEVHEKAFINTTAPNPETFQAPPNQFVNIPKYPSA